MQAPTVIRIYFKKRMSLPALVPVSNGSSHGLKLILLFCNYDMLLYLAAALIRLCHQSYKAFSYLHIRIIQGVFTIMPVIAFNRQVPALIKHRQRIFCIRSVINKILRLIWPAGQLLCPSKSFTKYVGVPDLYQ